MNPFMHSYVSVPLFRPPHSIPIIKPEELVEADGLIFGFPTRFGQPAAQMRALWDATGKVFVCCLAHELCFEPR